MNDETGASSQSAAGRSGGDASTAPPSGYFERHLHCSDAAGDRHAIDEAALLALTGGRIVLGEPGIGKSELMRELGRRLGTEPVTAVRFLLSKQPSRFLVPGKPILIDALDEAMSRREGDAVDMILAQLEEAGSPPFILSCRAREWQTRTITDLRTLYGADPVVCALEPLDRMEAARFIAQRFPAADAAHVLDHLDLNGLSDLYRNPLTLGLMGQVAEHDTQLPATRAGLFERVVTLIWPEHDPDRQDSWLAQISEDQALAAAGALSAGLLFAGAEAVNIAGVAQLQDGDVQLADIALLPHADHARAVLGSKLFQSVGPSRVKPIHRVIAEYLGARWLTREAATPRGQRRLLAQLHGAGGVPASLRGLHAWLAFHSPVMAARVIAADPFGILRYGETAALSADQADCLIEALRALASDDPYFRASDWDSRTAAGLMIPAMRDKIDALIASADSNWHLRSLLIEGLKNTALASDLASTLDTILLSPERFYREREDAAEALLPHRDRAWWQDVVAQLNDQGDEDATRLARAIINWIDCDVSDGLIVSAIFGEMGVTFSPLPRKKKRRIHTVRHYDDTLGRLPTGRLAGMLDLVTEYAALLSDSDWQNTNDVADIVSHLIVRAIDENAVGPADAGALWRWLGIIEHSQRYTRSSKQHLAARLADRGDIRQAVQLHASRTARKNDSLWTADIYMHRRLVGLSSRTADIAVFLERLSGADNRDKRLRQDWIDLVRMAHGPDGLDDGIRALADKFMRGDVQLAAVLHKLDHPKQPPWERRHMREEAKRERKRKVGFEFHRREFAKQLTDMRAGDLRAILNPAQAYFGRFRDLSDHLNPPGRIAEWLGTEIAEAALVGFETALHRRDLPSAAQVAQSFADEITYNYCYPIMAGLFERVRGGKDLADLSDAVRELGLLLCYNEFGWHLEEELPVLKAALEAVVFATPEAREAFLRLWMEPSLAARREHVRGIYMLAHDKDWLAAGAAVAADWLVTFAALPESVEAELIDCLTHAGALAALREIAAIRNAGVFNNFDHMLSWLAVDVLVRFDAVLPAIEGIADRNPEFIWFLRNRLQLERHGGMQPLTVQQAHWIISNFRRHWPYTSLSGSGSGDTNGYDATDFLRALISRLANDTSLEASDAMRALIADPADSYTDDIRHMAAEQRQKRAEADFAPLPPKGLLELLAGGPPSNADDLKSLVMEELVVAQDKLLGEDIDQVRDFWSDTREPREENRCRDRLAAIIGPELARYDIQRITEADMPKDKRVDLAFVHGQMQLPMEVKGQWHIDVWDAASGQLDLQYLIEWRSGQRGIYLVLWFGTLASATGRRLKAHPDGLKAPKSPAEMRTMLIDRIPEARRVLIDVVVLDLTALKPPKS